MTEWYYWTGKLVRNGPLVGLKTFHGQPYIDGEFVDRSPRWQALVHTETTARMILLGDQIPVEVDGVAIRNVEPTTRANYEHLIRHSAWAVAYSPDSPDATPREAVDFHKLTPF